MKGNVFDIQRFSIHDGPGVRVTVFLKGCPLRCKWCHNPEGLNAAKNLRFNPSLCIRCLRCYSCPSGAHDFTDGKHTIDWSKCSHCGLCAQMCPAGALMMYGESIEPSELAKRVAKDKDYFGEDGGVTFSGGEPLLQADFVSEAIDSIKTECGDVKICVDTSGYVPFDAFLKVADRTDIFLFDVKAFSDDIHFKATGVHNGLIKENLGRLNELGKAIWVRVPVIPGINDSDDELGKIARFIAPMKNVERVTLIPYHSLGYEKYEQMGLEYPFDPSREPKEGYMERVEAIFLKEGIRNQL